MKFRHSKTLANLAAFNYLSVANETRPITNPTQNLMRGLNDMYLVWKAVEYFQPNLLLEIGTFAGQTLGLMYEAAGPEAKIWSVDINHDPSKVFKNLFPDNTVVWTEIDSMVYESKDRYDFIHVDGDHDYTHATNDIKKALDMAHDNSIIVVDDYEKNWLQVIDAIKDLLLGQHNFVPFMLGDSSAFFHKANHDAGNFLDFWIQDRAQNFMHFYNIDFYSYTVLRPHFISQNTLTSSMPGLFQRALDLLKDSLDHYDL